VLTLVLVVQLLNSAIEAVTDLVSLEDHVRTWLQLLPRMHQPFPILGIRDLGLGIREVRRVRKPAKQKTLDSAAAWDAVADEARGKHARVVHDEEVAGAQMIRQLRKRRVLDRTGLPREDQESRLPTLGWRTLGDQFVGEFEIEIARP